MNSKDKGHPFTITSCLGAEPTSDTRERSASNITTRTFGNQNNQFPTDKPQQQRCKREASNALCGISTRAHQG